MATQGILILYAGHREAQDDQSVHFATRGDVLFGLPPNKRLMVLCAGLSDLHAPGMLFVTILDCFNPVLHLEGDRARLFRLLQAAVDEFLLV